MGDASEWVYPDAMYLMPENAKTFGERVMAERKKYIREDLYTAAIAERDTLRAEVERLRGLVPRPDQTADEILWRDYMRGVPLETLAREAGITRERMRHRIKRIAANMLALNHPALGGSKP